MTSITLPRSNITPVTTGYWVGNGDEIVVLLHGVGMRLEAWQPQLDLLAQHYRVLALDLPGHGDSQALAQGAQLPDFVHWLTDLLDTLQLGPVNLAGHSMGAFIAAGTVIEQPKAVKRLALLNGVYKRDEAARQKVIARAAQIADGEMGIEGPLTRWFSNDPANQAARAFTEQLLKQADPSGYAITYAAFAQGDTFYSDRLAEIACPALVLTGSDDANSSPDMAYTMAAEMQNGIANIIQDHRHMVNLTAPDAVNQALLAWLTDGGDWQNV